MPAARLIPTALCLAAGAALWLLSVIAQRSWPEQVPPLVALAVAGALIAIPRLRRRSIELLGHLSHPSPRARLVTAIAVAFVSFAYLAFTAHRQQRYLGPHWHDEHAYLLQAHMLALEARLWMP